MCLGVPGQLIETSMGSTGMRMGRVDFSGVVKDVCMEYLPEAAVGEFVVVHVGFAISTLAEEEATQLLELLGEMESAAG